MSLMLRDDVFMALSDGALVFLDLHRDRYCALDRVWSAHALRAFAGALDGDLEAALAERLAKAGLSCPTAPARAFALTQYLDASVELACDRACASGFAWPRAAFARACAAHALKHRPLAAIVAKRRRQRQLWRTHAPSSSNDPWRIKARVFRTLGAPAASDGRCLENALALIGFLGRAGVGVDWVFGVRAAPFSAHCWVQAGRCVLNDTLAVTRAYTPIMVV